MMGDTTRTTSTKVLDGGPFAVVGSYSQLLYAAEDDASLGAGIDGRTGFTSYSSSPCFSVEKSPQMLCFGNFEENYEMDRTKKKGVKLGVASCTDSSSTAGNNSDIGTRGTTGHHHSKKRNDAGQQLTLSPPEDNKPQTKAVKRRNKSSNVRKEKLGERITALQHLVSPYGKTDTASVLHEATGYIKFLQEQVQVLCSPYLLRPPSSPGGGENEVKQESASWCGDLMSRGLCLVPVACTAHVSNSNGADFWSPAAAMGSVPSKQF